MAENEAPKEMQGLGPGLVDQGSSGFRGSGFKVSGVSDSSNAAEEEAQKIKKGTDPFSTPGHCDLPLPRRL